MGDKGDVGLLIITSTSRGPRIRKVPGRIGRFDEIKQHVRNETLGEPAIVFYRYNYLEGATIFIYVRDELIDLGYASKPQLGSLLRDIAIFSRAQVPGMSLLWDIYSEIQAMLAKAEMAKTKWEETQGRNNKRYAEMEGYLSALEDVASLIKKRLR